MQKNVDRIEFAAHVSGGYAAYAVRSATRPDFTRGHFGKDYRARCNCFFSRRVSIGRSAATQDEQSEFGLKNAKRPAPHAADNGRRRRISRIWHMDRKRMALTSRQDSLH
jgi:hypothetical protein